MQHEDAANNSTWLIRFACRSTLTWNMKRETLIAELQRIAQERHTDSLSRSTSAELATISPGAVKSEAGAIISLANANSASAT
jgi:hypothetical protein